MNPDGSAQPTTDMPPDEVDSITHRDAPQSARPTVGRRSRA